MDGLVTMTPSSASGLISTSPDVDAGDDDTQSSFVKVNANGGVDFQNVVSLSLDGVFQGGDDGFDNYVVTVTSTVSATNTEYDLRMRASNDAIGQDYIFQQIAAINATVAGVRSPALTAWHVGVSGAIGDGSNLFFYGPALSRPTAIRAVTASSRDGALLIDHAGTHSSPTAYDGFTLIPNSSRQMTGNVIVMGYAE